MDQKYLKTIYIKGNITTVRKTNKPSRNEPHSCLVATPGKNSHDLGFRVEPFAKSLALATWANYESRC